MIAPCAYAMLVYSNFKENCMHFTYRHTLYASYLGYVTQAIVNNLAPLLFLTFQRELGLSLTEIALLISLNFMVQIAVDLLASAFADRVGYRAVAAAAHVFCFIGLAAMGLLPRLMGSPFAGLVTAVCINAVGGGLIEVIISPIVQSLPGEQKESAMSLLHSFYCWGHVAVVLLSTAFFLVFGLSHWPWLTALWALLPLFNFFLFLKVPLRTLNDDQPESHGAAKRISLPVMLLFLLLMVCAGASEQAMSQWASLFAEAGLRISKTMGDLLGPCLFAALMGFSRLIYGLSGNRLNLYAAMMASGGLCIAGYLLAVFSPIPLLALLGCGLCGFSVGLMWPGTFSLAAKRFPAGGTAMFAWLALAGDLGCSLGPGLVGIISGGVQREGGSLLAGILPAIDATQLGLKTGLFVAILFPVVLAVGIYLLKSIVTSKRGGSGYASQ